MPNIIVNNYCNQKCSYCFANDNMSNPDLQKNMSLATYIKILKYLSDNHDHDVRILGGEPLLFPMIRDFLQIANKGGFESIVFSNINIDPTQIEHIFRGITHTRVNCNINDKSFYSPEEQERIAMNIQTLQRLGIRVILGYNIASLENYDNFVFELAESYDIGTVNLKITNSSLGGELLIDNKSRVLGEFLFGLIKKHHRKRNIEISCGLDKSIFHPEELRYIKNETNIELKFGCSGNIGKFDINTDGSIFKCYPLESLFHTKQFSIDTISHVSIDTLVHTLSAGLSSDGECRGNRMIKAV